jgi:hypothetical protein
VPRKFGIFADGQKLEFLIKDPFQPNNSMKIKWLVLLACGSGVMAGTVASLHGQGSGSLPAASPTQSQQQSGPINFKILSQTQVNRADGTTTILNFVAPPVIPVPTPKPSPTPSAQYLQWLQTSGWKQDKLIMLSATVYDHQFTDLRIWVGNDSCRVISDIDFMYFTDTVFSEIETADTIYELFLMAGNETSEALTPSGASLSPEFVADQKATLGLLTQAKGQLPNLSFNPNSKSAYLIAENPTSNNGSALAALDALHAYYDANHAQLIASYRQGVAARAAAEAYAKTHPPPPPPPVVINYWPIKNSRYLTTGTAGTGGNKQ